MHIPAILSNLKGLIWVMLSLLPLIGLQRLLHREIQTLFFFITHNPDAAIILFAIVFLPGVFVHELSHLLVARLLGVHTGRFSLIPKPLPGGHLQLGYVETEQTDWVRASLVGAAPLITGGAIIGYLANDQLHLPFLWNFLQNGQANLFWLGLRSLPSVPNFWLWFYLTFVISSTMLPSNSDRRAWLPLGFVLIILFGSAILFGAGSWMLKNLVPGMNSFFYAVALLFGFSSLVHLILLIPFYGINRISARLSNIKNRRK